MQQMLAYIGLHCKLRFGKDAKADKKGKISSMIIGIATCVVMLLLLRYFFGVINDQLSASIDVKSFSTLIFLIVEIVLIVFGISMEVKLLLRPSDIKITARFPMSSFSMFVAELIMVYCYLAILSSILLASIMLIYGWAMGIISGVFIGRLILLMIFAPIFPFAVATLLAVPVMLALTLLDNHNYVKLLLFIAVLVSAFIIYNYVLNMLAEFYIHQRVDAKTLDSWAIFINAINSQYNIFAYYKDLQFVGGTTKGILIIFTMSLGLLMLGIVIEKPIYDRIRTASLEGGGKFFKKRIKITNDKPIVAILKKEFKEIIRTSTYAYFYLGIAITTPVMVFLCNKLVGKVGQAQVGGNIAFGVSMLVLTAFMAMINSFSATAISREDKAFYITKTIPVPFRKQLLAKGLLNTIVAIVALLISTIILVSLKFLSGTQTVVVFFTCLLGAVGLIANGYNINLRHPCLGNKANGDINETNVTRMMFVGLIFSAIEGGISIILAFLIEPIYVYVVNLSLAFIYSLVNVLIFALTSEKKYSEIEYR